MQFRQHISNLANKRTMCARAVDSWPFGRRGAGQQAIATSVRPGSWSDLSQGIKVVKAAGMLAE